MPNLPQIVGRPLPDSGMPAGTVSVRVARKMPANAVAGAEVSAIIKNAGGDLRRRTAKTDAERARAVRGGGPGRRVQRRGQRRRRAAEDRGVHDAAGGRHPDDADRRRSAAAAAAAAPAGGAAGEAPARAGKDGAASRWARPPARRRRTRRCPAGRWRSACFDENGAPIPNHPVLLGMVDKASKIDVRRGKSDAAGVARFTELARGRADRLRRRHRMARHAPRHGAVRDARERRRARRDPRARRAPPIRR